MFYGSRIYPDNNEDLIGGVNYNDGFRSVRFLFGTILRLNYTNRINSGNYTTPAEHWQYVLDEVWLDGWGEGDTITCSVTQVGTDVIFTITDGTVQDPTGTHSTWEYYYEDPVEVTQGDTADVLNGSYIEGEFNTRKTFTIGTSGGGNGGRGGQDGGYYGQGGGGGGAGGYTHPGGNAGGDPGSNGIGGGGGGGANSSERTRLRRWRRRHYRFCTRIRW